MRIYRDMGYVKSRKRTATLYSVLGVVLLATAFFLSFRGGPQNPNAVLFAYIPLLAGTVVFHMGMQLVGQWNRSPRNDEVLDSVLKDLGEKYALIHFAPAGKKTIPHLLIHPGGVLAIVVKEIAGDVTYANGKWSRSRAGASRLFGFSGPQLGNPTVEAQSNLAALNATLAEAGIAAPTDAAIVFPNRLAQLDIEEPDFPVVNGEGLPIFVKDLPADPAFKPEDKQRIIDLLAAGDQVQSNKMQTARRPVKRKAA